MTFATIRLVLSSPLTAVGFFVEAFNSGMTTATAVDNAAVRLSARSAYRLQAAWRAKQDAGLTGAPVGTKWSWVKAHDGLIWPVDAEYVELKTAQKAAIGTKEERRCCGCSMSY